MPCMQIRTAHDGERSELKSRLQSLENDVRVVGAQLHQSQVCLHVTALDNSILPPCVMLKLPCSSRAPGLCMMSLHLLLCIAASGAKLA